MAKRTAVGEVGQGKSVALDLVEQLRDPVKAFRDWWIRRRDLP